MTEDNEHAKTLKAARDKSVTKRRELAAALAMPSTRGESEEMLERFSSLQGTIAAIEDAIKHKRNWQGRSLLWWRRTWKANRAMFPG
jgi:hypothetical protein